MHLSAFCIVVAYMPQLVKQNKLTLSGKLSLKKQVKAKVNIHLSQCRCYYGHAKVAVQLMSEPLSITGPIFTAVRVMAMMVSVPANCAVYKYVLYY